MIVMIPNENNVIVDVINRNCLYRLQALNGFKYSDEVIPPEIRDEDGNFIYKIENGVIVERSEEEKYPLEELKEDTISLLKNNAYNKIIQRYPIWKQMNIQSLNGYFESERYNMISFIYSVRQNVKVKELEINTKKTHKEVKEVDVMEI